jgi:excisionase family DNA binding protein
MDYNATATLMRPFAKMTDNETDDMLDHLAAYHPAIGVGPIGEAEIVITFPAETLAQALQTASAVLAEYRPVGFEVIPTEVWDRRVGLESIPELLSVAQAASKLGVTRQAVLQRINAGSLPARKVGATWAVPAVAVCGGDDPAWRTA